VISTAGGIATIPKFFDQDNKYGLIDYWQSLNNQTQEYYTARTSSLPLFNEDGTANPSRFFPEMAHMAATIMLFDAGGGEIEKLFAGANAIKGSTLAYKAGTVLTALAQTHNDFYNQLVNKDLTDQQKGNLALALGTANGLSMLLVPGIGKGLVSQQGLNTMVKEYVAGKSLDDIFTPLLKDVINTNLAIQSFTASGKIINGIANEIVGKDVLDTQYKTSEFLDNIFVATGTSFLLGHFNAHLKGNDREQVLNQIAGHDGRLETAISTIQSNVDSKLITQDRATELITELTTRNAQLKALPETYNDNKKGAIVELQNQLSGYEKKEYAVGENGQIVEKKLSPAEQQAKDILTTQIEELKNKPNEYFDNLKLTEQQKAEELNKGNDAPITSALENLGEKNPQEVADEIKPIIEKAEELKSESVVDTKIKSGFESNIEALINPETGLSAVTTKALDEQQPYKDAFLKRIGLSIEDYRKLDDTEKQKVQDQWVASDEFKQISDLITTNQNEETQKEEKTNVLTTDIETKKQAELDQYGLGDKTIGKEFKDEEKANEIKARMKEMQALRESDGSLSKENQAQLDELQKELDSVKFEPLSPAKQREVIATIDAKYDKEKQDILTTKAEKEKLAQEQEKSLNLHNEEVSKLEKEKNSKIGKETMLKLDIKEEDLANAKDPIGKIKEYKTLKEKAGELNKLIKCLW
jgi:hypothetical protein